MHYLYVDEGIHSGCRYFYSTFVHYCNIIWFKMSGFWCNQASDRLQLGQTFKVTTLKFYITAIHQYPVVKFRFESRHKPLYNNVFTPLICIEQMCRAHIILNHFYSFFISVHSTTLFYSVSIISLEIFSHAKVLHMDSFV